jgi:catechol 2,3-dioxygenase-like lactoylglutathione lyase family enzyme
MSSAAGKSPSQPVISRTAAQLFVSDITASCEFFSRKLGFSTVFVYGEPPFYAQVKRGGGLLNLRHVDRPVIDPLLRDSETLLSADLALDSHDELTQLYLEFQAAGVPFFQTLRKEPWRASTIIVRDPDGNLLVIAAPAS